MAHDFRISAQTTGYVVEFNSFDSTIMNMTLLILNKYLLL